MNSIGTAWRLTNQVFFLPVVCLPGRFKPFTWNVFLTQMIRMRIHGGFCWFSYEAKALLGFRGQCGLRSVPLPPCHCTGTLAALSSEAGVVFCSSELALSQSSLLPREGMFILVFCSFCTEKRVSSSPGCGLSGLWYPCHSLNFNPQIILHHFLGLLFLRRGEANSGRCWLCLWYGFSDRETLPWSSG